MFENFPFSINRNRLRKVRDILYKTPLYRRTYQLAHLKTPLFDHVLIQTNNRCTRKCTFCWYGMKDVVIPDDELPEWLFQKIIGDLAAIDYFGRVSLFEMNEPMTDPRIFEWVRYTKQKLPKSWQILASNGDLLTQDKAVKLFQSGVDFLNISSYSDNSYRNVKFLLEKLSKEISGRITNRRMKNEHMSDNRGGNLPHIETVSEPIKEPCRRVNHILYIKPSGNVVSCFGDYFNVNLLGNAKEQSVTDIWFGETFETLRKHLNRGDRTKSDLCRQCNLDAGTYFFTRKIQKQWTKEMKKARSGIIVGASQSAHLFFPALKQCAQIQSVVSKSNSSDSYFQNRNVPLTNNLEKALSDVELDFVFVANRNCDHFDTAKKALLAYKHVLIDKPMTIQVQQLDELMKLAHSKNLLLGGVFQWRFLKLAQLAKKWMAEGKFGDLLFINTQLLWNRDQGYYVRGRGTWEVDGGGVLIKQAIHCLDLQIYLGGQPKSWEGRCSNRTPGLETEDTAEVSIQFDQGLAGSLVSTVSYKKEMKPEIEIVGTKGRLIFNTRDEILLWDLPFQSPKFLKKKNIFREQIKNFIESIGEPSKLIVTAEESRKSLVIIEDIYRKSFPNLHAAGFTL